MLHLVTNIEQFVGKMSSEVSLSQTDGGYNCLYVYEVLSRWSTRPFGSGDRGSISRTCRKPSLSQKTLSCGGRART